MSKKFIAYFFSLFFLIPQFLVATGPLSCDVSAPIAVLIDADTGKVLFSKGGDLPRFPASTTKIATALYIRHKGNLPLAQKITASFDAISVVSPSQRRRKGLHPSYRLEFGGTHMGIKKGEELDVKTLLYGLMLSSGNDAANVLAEATSGSVSKFMEELNEFLAEIGCTSTSLQNPHGMPDPLQLTTAKDLACMARLAMQDPFFQEVVSSTQYKRPKTNKQESFFLSQHNALLKPGKYYYPYATGVKTGYTVGSGFVLVSAASKNDRNLIAVVMQCDEKAKRYRSSIAMFETAFNEPKVTRKLLSKEHDQLSTFVEGAKKEIKAGLPEDFTVSFYPSMEEELAPKVSWYPLSLPVKSGEEVGKIELIDSAGKVLKVVQVLALEDVQPTWTHRCKQIGWSVQKYLKAKKVYGGYLFAFVLLGMPFLRLLHLRRRSKEDKTL